MSYQSSRAAQVTILSGVLVVGLLLGGWITRISASARYSSKPDELTLPQAATQKTARPGSTPMASSSSESSDPMSTSSGHRRSLEEILRHPNGDRTKELEEFARTLATTQFGATLKALRKMPDNSARELALRMLVARWTDVDPEGALQFAAGNRDFDYIASDVFQQFAGDNMQSALARAQGITDPNLRYEALKGVLSYMAEQDPLGALKLAGTMGSFPNNEPLTQVIYRQWSDIDPQAAAAQASLDSSGSEPWRSPVGQVLRNWASQDPLAALAWSTSLPDAAAQSRDVGQIIRQWSRSDLNAAANWVDSLPAGGVRDSAVASLAYSIGGTDPTAAIGWAQSIADSTARDNALQRLSQQIMYRDPANGAAILRAAGVPANLIPPPPDPNQRGGRRGGGR